MADRTHFHGSILRHGNDERDHSRFGKMHPIDRAPALFEDFPLLDANFAKVRV